MPQTAEKATLLPLGRSIGGVAVAALLFALLLAGAAPSEDEGGKPRLLNGPGIMTVQDYPLEALRNGQEGSVTVRLTVSPSGTVSSCRVTESSGHPALDERTCAIYHERAKFVPATDAAGRAIESHFTQRTSWKLAESGMPRTPWVVRFTLARAADGSAVDCTIEATGVPGMSSQCPIPKGLEPKAGTDAKPVGFTMTETRFYPVDPSSAPVAPYIEGAKMFAKQVSRITITPDGQVIACKGILYSGEAATKQDSCALGGLPRFEAAPEGSGPMVATLVQAAYVLGAAATESDQGDPVPKP